jgi:hypothetical protein
MLTHKEMTAHLRKRIKIAGIKARVDMMDSCGSKAIRVFGASPEATFTDEEQRQIRHIAKCNGLTWVRGMEIDVEQMTNPQSFHFYLPAFNKEAEEAHA